MHRRTDASSPDSLDAVLVDAGRDLGTAEDRLLALLERATALASTVEHERGQLQLVLEELALEQSVADGSMATGGDQAAPLLDLSALRRGAQEMTDELARAGAVRAELAVAVQTVRTARERLVPTGPARSDDGADEIRVQHAAAAAREDERRRLAREIHDGPAQVLANAIFAVDLAGQVARRNPEQVGAELARVRELLRDGVAEVRRFMLDLRPTVLEDQGLAAALRHVAAEHERRFNLRVALALDEPLPDLTPEQELAVFRIVQEALQNVRKHAQVEEARIALGHSGRRLLVRVEDRGRGFDPATIFPHSDGGAGLPGMRQRAKLSGAELTIVSEPGLGTTVTVVLPLRQPTSRLPATAPGAEREGVRS